MGVDCPNVRQKIHLGTLEEKESYIQETGQAGCDGQQAFAMLLFVKGMRQYVDKGIKKYIMNCDLCRRKFVF